MDAGDRLYWMGTIAICGGMLVGGMIGSPALAASYVLVGILCYIGMFFVA